MRCQMMAAKKLPIRFRSCRRDSSNPFAYFYYLSDFRSGRLIDDMFLDSLFNCCLVKVSSICSSSHQFHIRQSHTGASCFQSSQVEDGRRRALFALLVLQERSLSKQTPQPLLLSSSARVGPRTRPPHRDPCSDGLKPRPGATLQPWRRARLSNCIYRVSPRGPQVLQLLSGRLTPLASSPAPHLLRTVTMVARASASC